MPGFIWQGGNEVSACADLRARGWSLLDTAPVARCTPANTGALILIDGSHRISLPWRTPLIERTPLHELRRRVLLFGVDNPHERARLLRIGLGDVMASDFEFDEFAVRARRVLAMAAMLPRARRHGPLRLELLARDGYVDGKRLGLHPREFALVWRLMEEPGRAVDKATLLRDVWNLDYTPETNSLAVHARRLRAKLEIAGLPGVIRSTPGGGYALADWFPDHSAEPHRPFLFDTPMPEPADQDETASPEFWRS